MLYVGQLVPGVVRGVIRSVDYLWAVWGGVLSEEVIFYYFIPIS